MLTYYDTRYQAIHGSYSKGRDLKYHTKDIPPALLEAIDQQVATRFPTLWITDLKRFKES